MDEKTEELRDIFVDVAGDSTVTEEQAEARGSLTDEDDQQTTARLEAVLERMKERYEFDADLDDEARKHLLVRFFEGADDEEIAAELDVSAQTVFLGRTDLHLLRESDLDAPFDLDALREHLDGGATVAEATTRFDVAESTIRRYERVLDTRYERRQVNGRFRDEFEELLTDADLGARMTEDVRETGLEDATEGMETDVSF
jgi:hypothetical protein